MPNYAFLDIEVRCPECGSFISDRVAFQWGYCPGSLQIREQTYHVGDLIRWHRCAGGTILPWAYFLEGTYRGAANIGNPAFVDVLTQDMESFVWEDPARVRVCYSCGMRQQGAVVEIRGGVIQGIWVYHPGDLDPIAQDYVIEHEGTRTAMLDWTDHPMNLVENC